MCVVTPELYPQTSLSSFALPTRVLGGRDRYLRIEKTRNKENNNRVYKSTLYPQINPSNTDIVTVIKVGAQRLDILSQAESYVGKYFSDAYVRKHILHFSEDDIERIQGEMDGEGHEDDSDGF